jgi:hypothetical protein
MLASRGQEDSADQEQPKSVVRIMISNVQRRPDAVRVAIAREAQLLAPAPTHPDTLVFSTLAADAAVGVCGIRAVRRSSRRVAVRAASSLSDHSRPHT